MSAPPLELEYKTAGVLDPMVGTAGGRPGGGPAVVPPPAADGETGIVEFYAAITGVEDEVKDIITPGAFARTLGKRRPKVCLGHDWNRPVGKTLDVKELLPGDPALPARTATGKPWPRQAGALWMRTQYNLATKDGYDAYQMAKFYGPEESLYSIGYVVTRADDRRGMGGKRRIHDLDLYEAGPVLHPAHPLANLGSVKSLPPEDIETKMRYVRDAEFWGKPIGTPITPGMKPRGKVARAMRRDGKRPSDSAGTMDYAPDEAQAREIEAAQPKSTAARARQIAREQDDEGLFAEPASDSRLRATNRGKDRSDEHLGSLGPGEDDDDEGDEDGPGARLDAFSTEQRTAMAGLLDEGLSPDEVDQGLDRDIEPEHRAAILEEYRQQYAARVAMQRGGKAPTNGAAPPSPATADGGNVGPQGTPQQPARPPQAPALGAPSPAPGVAGPDENIGGSPAVPGYDLATPGQLDQPRAPGAPEQGFTGGRVSAPVKDRDASFSDTAEGHATAVASMRGRQAQEHAASLSDQQLDEVDAEMTRRAELLGRADKINKGHAALRAERDRRRAAAPEQAPPPAPAPTPAAPAPAPAPDAPSVNELAARRIEADTVGTPGEEAGRRHAADLRATPEELSARYGGEQTPAPAPAAEVEPDGAPAPADDVRSFLDEGLPDISGDPERTGAYADGGNRMLMRPDGQDYAPEDGAVQHASLARGVATGQMTVDEAREVRDADGETERGLTPNAAVGRYVIDPTTGERMRVSNLGPTGTGMVSVRGVADDESAREFDMDPRQRLAATTAPEGSAPIVANRGPSGRDGGGRTGRGEPTPEAPSTPTPEDPTFTRPGSVDIDTMSLGRGDADSALDARDTDDLARALVKMGFNGDAEDEADRILAMPKGRARSTLAALQRLNQESATDRKARERREALDALSPSERLDAGVRNVTRAQRNAAIEALSDDDLQAALDDAHARERKIGRSQRLGDIRERERIDGTIAQLNMERRARERRANPPPPREYEPITERAVLESVLAGQNMSTDELADEFGTSMPHMRRILRGLERDGFVNRNTEDDGSGGVSGGRSNLNALVWESPDGMDRDTAPVLARYDAAGRPNEVQPRRIANDIGGGDREMGAPDPGAQARRDRFMARSRELAEQRERETDGQPEPTEDAAPEVEQDPAADDVAMEDIPAEQVDEAFDTDAQVERESDAAVGLDESPDGEEEISEADYARQNRVSVLVRQDSERLSRTLARQSDEELGTTRRELADELALQNRMEVRKPHRPQPRTPRDPEAAPRRKPGVAGAAEDLADAKGTERAPEALQELRTSLNRSRSTDAAVVELRERINAGETPSNAELRDAAKAMRAEHRARRNEGAKRRRKARRIERDRIRSVIGQVDVEMRARNLRPESYGPSNMPDVEALARRPRATQRETLDGLDDVARDSMRAENDARIDELQSRQRVRETPELERRQRLGRVLAEADYGGDGNTERYDATPGATERMAADGRDKTGAPLPEPAREPEREPVDLDPQRDPVDPPRRNTGAVEDRPKDRDGRLLDPLRTNHQGDMRQLDDTELERERAAVARQFVDAGERRDDTAVEDRGFLRARVQAAEAEQSRRALIARRDGEREERRRTAPADDRTPGERIGAATGIALLTRLGEMTDDELVELLSDPTTGDRRRRNQIKQAVSRVRSRRYEEEDRAAENAQRGTGESTGSPDVEPIGDGGASGGEYLTERQLAGRGARARANDRAERRAAQVADQRLRQRLESRDDARAAEAAQELPDAELVRLDPGFGRINKVISDEWSRRLQADRDDLYTSDEAFVARDRLGSEADVIRKRGDGDRNNRRRSPEARERDAARLREIDEERRSWNDQGRREAWLAAHPDGASEDNISVPTQQRAANSARDNLTRRVGAGSSHFRQRAIGDYLDPRVHQARRADASRSIEEMEPEQRDRAVVLRSLPVVGRGQGKRIDEERADVELGRLAAGDTSHPLVAMRKGSRVRITGRDQYRQEFTADDAEITSVSPGPDGGLQVGVRYRFRTSVQRGYNSDERSEVVDDRHTVLHMPAGESPVVTDLGREDDVAAPEAPEPERAPLDLDALRADTDPQQSEAPSLTDQIIDRQNRLAATSDRDEQLQLRRELRDIRAQQAEQARVRREEETGRSDRAMELHQQARQAAERDEPDEAADLLRQAEETYPEAGRDWETYQNGPTRQAVRAAQLRAREVPDGDGGLSYDPERGEYRRDDNHSMRLTATDPQGRDDEYRARMIMEGYRPGQQAREAATDEELERADAVIAGLDPSREIDGRIETARAGIRRERERRAREAPDAPEVPEAPEAPARPAPYSPEQAERGRRMAAIVRRVEAGNGSEQDGYDYEEYMQGRGGARRERRDAAAMRAEEERHLRAEAERLPDDMTQEQADAYREEQNLDARLMNQLNNYRRELGRPSIGREGPHRRRMPDGRTVDQTVTDARSGRARDAVLADLDDADLESLAGSHESYLREVRHNPDISPSYNNRRQWQTNEKRRKVARDIRREQERRGTDRAEDPEETSPEPGVEISPEDVAEALGSDADDESARVASMTSRTMPSDTQHANLARLASAADREQVDEQYEEAGFDSRAARLPIAQARALVERGWAEERAPRDGYDRGDGGGAHVRITDKGRAALERGRAKRRDAGLVLEDPSTMRGSRAANEATRDDFAAPDAPETPAAPITPTDMDDDALNVEIERRFEEYNRVRQAEGTGSVNARRAMAAWTEAGDERARRRQQARTRDTGPVAGGTMQSPAVSVVPKVTPTERTWLRENMTNGGGDEAGGARIVRDRLDVHNPDALRSLLGAQAEGLRDTINETRGDERTAARRELRTIEGLQAKLDAAEPAKPVGILGRIERVELDDVPAGGARARREARAEVPEAPAGLDREANARRVDAIVDSWERAPGNPDRRQQQVHEYPLRMQVRRLSDEELADGLAHARDRRAETVGDRSPEGRRRTQGYRQTVEAMEVAQAERRPVADLTDREIRDQLDVLGIDRQGAEGRSSERVTGRVRELTDEANRRENAYNEENAEEIARIDQESADSLARQQQARSDELRARTTSAADEPDLSSLTRSRMAAMTDEEVSAEARRREANQAALTEAYGPSSMEFRTGRNNVAMIQAEEDRRRQAARTAAPDPGVGGERPEPPRVPRNRQTRLSEKARSGADIAFETDSFDPAQQADDLRSLGGYVQEGRLHVVDKRAALATIDNHIEGLDSNISPPGGGIAGDRDDLQRWRSERNAFRTLRAAVDKMPDDGATERPAGQAADPATMRTTLRGDDVGRLQRSNIRDLRPGDRVFMPAAGSQHTVHRDGSVSVKREGATVEGVEHEVVAIDRDNVTTRTPDGVERTAPIPNVTARQNVLRLMPTAEETDGAGGGRGRA